ncbi:CCN family member 3 [Ornithorhynchus anatinus]|uniref:CCN family member 3 n=1 Tax=Ornithorhynchus anatinus TaxID=9258 RepID=A0A6I8NHB8_ORNAN|nr:CCN family member 3 [Ornithorhynchus anatinus]
MRNGWMLRLPAGAHPGAHSLRPAFLPLLLLLAQVTLAERRCPWPCPGPCPAEPPGPPACAPGVPAVPAGCACCQVCAAQRGEPCSPSRPCHESRGLRCRPDPDPDGRPGVCTAVEGDNCVFDGTIYRSGETFQPSCKYQCSCRDGQVGCVPRCHQDLLLPGPDCPFPRKVEVPGECCEQWICDPPDGTSLAGVALAAFRQEATVGIAGPDSSLNCIEQTTAWSACSQSCGLGVSTRATNKNRRCEMVQQARLCVVRVCGQEDRPQVGKRGKKCLRTQKSLQAMTLHHQNCTSLQTYKPRFCGTCGDGRCCTPHHTKTVQVPFRCPHGRIIEKPVMFVATCACHANCPENDAAFIQG